jgi:hypothetical protein
MESDSYLSDIMFVENEKISDFSANFITFFLLQFQQIIRKLNHRISIKLNHDGNDTRTMELVERLAAVY